MLSSIARTVRCFACCSLLVITCNGCITGSIITIGTVLGALGSAASTGSDVYKLGKLDATLMTSTTQCHQGVLQAAADLGLTVVIDDHADVKEDVWEMTLHDEKKAPLGVHIERRTGKMCRIRIDVGIFGSEPTSRLFMQRVRTNLHLPAASQPTDTSNQ